MMWIFLIMLKLPQKRYLSEYYNQIKWQSQQPGDLKMEFHVPRSVGSVSEGDP